MHVCDIIAASNDRGAKSTIPWPHIVAIIAEHAHYIM